MVGPPAVLPLPRCCGAARVCLCYTKKAGKKIAPKGRSLPLFAKMSRWHSTPQGYAALPCADCPKPAGGNGPPAPAQPLGGALWAGRPHRRSPSGNFPKLFSFPLDSRGAAGYNAKSVQRQRVRSVAARKSRRECSRSHYVALLSCGHEGGGFFFAKRERRHAVSDRPERGWAMGPGGPGNQPQPVRTWRRPGRRRDSRDGSRPT